MADFQRCEFIDLSQPMLPQILWGNFSKEFYLEQVHQPRHVTYSARMFPYPWLEVSTHPLRSLSHWPPSLTLSTRLPPFQVFTVTPWYVVPLVWVPITVTLFVLSMLQFSAPTAHFTARSLLSLVASGKALSIPLPTVAAAASTVSLWAVGCFLWTVLEYVFHRFLFHLDYYLPDNNVALLIHFTAHGVHHFLPMVS